MNRLLSLTLVLVLLLVTAAPAHADTTYVVRPGDTLFSIAVRFGVSMQAIMQANGITNADRIFAGQVLRIPTGTSGTSPNTGGSTGGTASGGTSPGRCGATYTIQRGETLRIIAEKCGTTISTIASLNGILNVDRIFAGQVLRMPGSSSGSTGGSTTVPTAPAATPAPPP